MHSTWACLTSPVAMGHTVHMSNNRWRMGEKMAAFQVNVTNGLASSLLHQHQIPEGRSSVLCILAVQCQYWVQNVSN